MNTDFIQYRPTAALIDLGAFARNARLIMSHSNVPIMGIIKADAYGHGAVPCARILQDVGAGYGGVAMPEEALNLRKKGIGLPLLILGKSPKEALPALAAANVDCTLASEKDARTMQSVMQNEAAKIRVHIKLDTGMSRLGIPPDEIGLFSDMLNNCDKIELAGIFTHFSSADSYDLSKAKRQKDAFDTALALLADRGIRPPLIHASASSAIHNLPDARYDMVRPGISLYGGVQPCCEAFVTEPVMTLESRIVAERWFKPGTTVSYGDTYTCQKNTRIAVVPVGYADGLPRIASGRWNFFVAGQLAPVLGRICMDMTMIDVTHIPEAKEGSRVVIFGNPAREGKKCPTVNQLAELLNTIPYEILCGISPRVPRVYEGI